MRKAPLFFPQRENPIEDLYPNAEYATPAADRDGLQLLNRMNRQFQETRQGDSGSSLG